MAAISIIYESTVRPSRPTESTHRIELTPWDLQFLLVHYNQKGLLFPKPPVAFRRQNDHNPENEDVGDVIDHLKTSLSRTLNYFFPLAGRLAATTHDSGATSFHIDCNDAGAQFVHAATEAVTTADILDSVYTPSIVNSFFAFNGVLNYEGTSNPLLGIQATELADGGIFLACSVNHCLVDGMSFWNFFNSWSELSRTSSDRISRPPILDRWFLDHSHCPIRIPDFPCHGKPILPRFFYPPPLKDRVFNFRKEKIQNLKAKANAEIGSKKISRLQALLAHLWRAVTRIKQIPPNMKIPNQLMVDARARLTPPLPEEYFGNATAAAAAIAKAGDLQTQGLGFAAAEMNKMVGLQTEDEMRRFLEHWTEDPKLWRHTSAVINALVTGSSPRFNVYGNDFGWGRPAAVRSGGANKLDGKMTMFPGREEGSIDVEACLLPETLEAMAEDEEFMEAVTV